MRYSIYLIMIVSMFYISCQKKQEENQNTVLKIVIPWVNEELESFLPVLEEFESNHPKITVEYQNAKPEDISTILSIQFQAQETPADVIDTSFGWYIHQQAKSGHILGLDDVFDVAEFIKGSFDEVTVDGSLYGVPSVGGITVPEYRKSLFNEYGLQSPQAQDYASIREFLDAVRDATGTQAVLASGGGVGWTFTSILETWLLIFGGSELHKQLRQGKISWQSPQVRQILAQELLPLIRDAYFSEPDEYEALLKSMWSGKYPLFIGDSTDLQIVSPPEDLGTFLFPGQDAVVFWHDYWFVPKYTKHETEAKELISFLATRGQEIQVANGGRIGSYLSIAPELYSTKGIQDVLSLLKDVTVVPDLDDSIGGKFQTTIWTQLALLWAEPDEETLDRVLERLQEASLETLETK